MLIGSNGDKQGLVSIDLALDSAKTASLDLVQVSPSDANPVVCKLLDYGKHIFEKKKSTSSSKVKVKRNTVKEIKFRPGTDIHDYDVKMRSVYKFLENGDKVKITMRFRGREMAHQELGRELLERVAEDVKEHGKVENIPKLEGRQMTMMIGPMPTK